MAKQIQPKIQCSICFEYHDRIKMVQVNPCNHEFCRECIGEWWYDCNKNSCPMCRRKCKNKKGDETYFSSDKQLQALAKMIGAF